MGGALRDTIWWMLDDEGNVAACHDSTLASLWFEQSGMQRRVKRIDIGPITVSTVFLAIDHGFLGHGPILWETMAFDCREEWESRDIDCHRNPTRADAQLTQLAFEIKYRAQWPRWWDWWYWVYRQVGHFLRNDWDWAVRKWSGEVEYDAQNAQDRARYRAYVALKASVGGR